MFAHIRMLRVCRFNNMPYRKCCMDVCVCVVQQSFNSAQNDSHRLLSVYVVFAFGNRFGSWVYVCIYVCDFVKSLDAFNLKAVKICT